ncbi:MAG: site-specific integrase [Lachnospiraceae bacterium]|nr:site-specific integrase [Lachnospiraceae bacterium]
MQISWPGITKEGEPKKYEAIGDIMKSFLTYICDADEDADIYTLDLRTGAENYLKKGGLSEDEITAIEEYITDNNISSNEYIFKNMRGGAYSADRFSKDFKKYLIECGIAQYSFKSHDFRHAIATMFYENGVSIEVIRDYLGHKESQMTTQYVDHQQRIVDKLNAAYLSKDENRIYRRKKEE